MSGSPPAPTQRVINNTILDNFLDPLHDLLVTAMAGRVPVIWDEPGGLTEWYEVTVGSPTDQFVAQESGMQTRRYTARVDYVRLKGGLRRLDVLTRISERVESIKGTLQQNLDYSPSSTYCWHDGQIGDIDYQAATDEDMAADRARVSIIFSASVTEALA